MYMAYICVRGQRVPELCPFVQINLYPYSFISCDKAEIGGILITISNTSSFSVLHSKYLNILTIRRTYI